MLFKFALGKCEWQHDPKAQTCSRMQVRKGANVFGNALRATLANFVFMCSHRLHDACFTNYLRRNVNLVVRLVRKRTCIHVRMDV